MCQFALSYVNKTSLALQPRVDPHVGAEGILSRQDLGAAGDLGPGELLQELRTSSVVADIPWLDLSLGVAWSWDKDLKDSVLGAQSAGDAPRAMN